MRWCKRGCKRTPARPGGRDWGFRPARPVASELGAEIFGDQPEDVRAFRALMGRCAGDERYRGSDEGKVDRYMAAILSDCPATAEGRDRAGSAPCFDTVDVLPAFRQGVATL